MKNDPPDKPLLHAWRGPGRPRKHPKPEEVPKLAPPSPDPDTGEAGIRTFRTWVPVSSAARRRKDAPRYAGYLATGRIRESAVEEFLTALAQMAADEVLAKLRNADASKDAKADQGNQISKRKTHTP